MHWKRVVPMAAMLAVLPANMAAADSPEDALEKMDRILEIEKEDTGDGQVMMRSTNFDPSEWIRYDNLLPELERIAELSDGEFDIDVLGQSQRGRDIYSTRIGTGDEVILITSEIHGNENFGTESLVSLLETLATSDEEEVQFILDEITVVAVPKFNPDGAELVQRQNDITWDEVVENHPQLEGAEPAWNYNESRQGFDVNRDFNADLDYVPEAADLPGNTANFGFFLSNESQILRDLYQELQAEFGGVEAYVDLHQMGANNVIEGTDEPVTIALDYPALGPDGNPRYADDYPEWDQDKSRKYALAAANGVNERADGGVEPGLARYVHHSTRDLPGQARHAFALNGTGTVLFEMPGQQPNAPYDQNLIDIMEDGLWGILHHMADGINQLDGDDFYELPKYWPDTPPVSEPAQFATDFTENAVGESPSDWSPFWQARADQFTVLDLPTRLQFLTGSGSVVSYQTVLVNCTVIQKSSGSFVEMIFTGRCLSLASICLGLREVRMAFT